MAPPHAVNFKDSHTALKDRVRSDVSSSLCERVNVPVEVTSEPGRSHYHESCRLHATTRNIQVVYTGAIYAAISILQPSTLDLFITHAFGVQDEAMVSRVAAETGALHCCIIVSLAIIHALCHNDGLRRQE